MNLSQHDRTAIFVDGPNLDRTARSVGLNIDFDAVLREFGQRTRLVGASYFTSVKPGPDGEPLTRFLSYLGHHGWRVVTGDAKEFTDAAGVVRYKDRTDVALAVSMVQQAPRFDHIVLFSGDGDFCPAVEAAQQAGARVTVVSSFGLPNARRCVSEDLIQSADEFVDLLDIAECIERRPEVEGLAA